MAADTGEGTKQSLVLVATASVTNSVKEKMLILGEGNPGGLTVCVNLYQKFGVDALKLLDESGLRGTKIWEFFINCDRDLDKTFTELRRMIFEKV